DFSGKLKRKGATAALTATVTTSFRRWDRHGPLWTILLMWTLRFLYRVGVGPHTLNRWYGLARWSMKQPSSQSPDVTHRSPHAALVIFAKAPIPGEVKTRLCPPLTPDEAATLHGSFVLDMLERSKLAVATLQLPFHRYLACAPSSDLVFFKIMEERQGVRLLDQVGEDLGLRMHHTFVDLFTKGYKQVIIVGTDVPTLPLSVYQEAFAILGRSDVVLGPALDGGYYLIGLKQPTEKLF